MNRNRKRKPLSVKTRKILTIAGSAVVLAVLCALLITGIVAKRREGTTIIGFYEVDGAAHDAVLTVLNRSVAVVSAAEISDSPRVKFIELTEQDILNPKITEKVDLLITKTGAVTTALQPATVPFGSVITERYPGTVRNSPVFCYDDEMCVMPLVFNHFETAYLSVLFNQLSLQVPKTLTALVEFAGAARVTAANPIIAAGKDDAVLSCFVSALVESVCGGEGYCQLVTELAGLADFDAALELPLAGDAPAGLVFGDVLAVITGWQREGLLLPEWYKTGEETVRVFMEDAHAAVIEMLLSQHRRMPSPMIKYFEGYQFPADTSIQRGIIAPSYSCMLFRKTAAGLSALTALSSSDEQEYLSAWTQLAPATLRGQAFDVQADDVRYLAAVNPSGPLPDIATAAFAEQKKRGAFVSWLREKFTLYQVQ